MPRIVIFDEAASPQRVIEVTDPSEDEGPWVQSARTDYVVNPDLSALAVIDPVTLDITSDLVPRRYWKHQAGAIVEYTAGEKSTQDAADAAAEAAAQVARDAADRQSAKDIRQGRSGFDIHARATRIVVVDLLNVRIRAIRQIVDEILASTDHANMVTRLTNLKAARDWTNTTKAEYNTDYDAAVDVLNLDDPGSDA